MRLLKEGVALCAIMFFATSANAFEAGGASAGTGANNVAIGNGWTRIDNTSEWSTAVGVGAEVREESSMSTAIGMDAKVGVDGGGSRDSTAVGARATIGSDSFSSTAVGNHSQIGDNSQESTAIGQAASVGDDASGGTAVGHRANVAAGTTNASALGRDAMATHDNSVALGAGSATQRGAEAGYAGYGLAGTESSVGEVAVGTGGGNRTITGVASGIQDADAVNVKQLKAVNQSAVKYDETTPGVPDYTQITLGQGAVGTAPVLLRNVQSGAISASSFDAVNGAQIHAISQSAAAAFGGGSTVLSDGTISAPSYSIGGTTYDNVGSALSALDNGMSRLNAEIKSQAGKAGAVGLAASSLRFDDRPGKISVAAGGGVWNNYGAMAFGAGYTTLDQRIRANVSGVTTGDKWGVAAGVSFTLN